MVVDASELLPHAGFDPDLVRVPGVALWQPPPGTGPT
jgi:hypothetical protein